MSSEIQGSYACLKTSHDYSFGYHDCLFMGIYLVVVTKMMDWEVLTSLICFCKHRGTLTAQCFLLHNPQTRVILTIKNHEPNLWYVGQSLKMLHLHFLNATNYRHNLAALKSERVIQILKKNQTIKWQHFIHLPSVTSRHGPEIYCFIHSKTCIIVMADMI